MVTAWFDWTIDRTLTTYDVVAFSCRFNLATARVCCNFVDDMMGNDVIVCEGVLKP